MYNNFPADFYDYLNTHTLVEIKSGKDRLKFTEIWMVTVGNRVFARSWNKNASGWMNDFLKNNGGQIKYGEKVLNAFANKIDVNDSINDDISRAYIDKYTQEYNIDYTKEIAQKKYYDFTVEFIASN